MGVRARAVMALVCAAAAQVGCASKLDFDRVSSGHHPRAEANAAADASAADAGTRGSVMDADAGAALDAIAPSVSHDTGTSPFAAVDGAADFGSGGGAGAAAFSCRSVAPRPYFCDDFEILALRDHWTDVLVEPTVPTLGGSIEIDSNAARAGHDSLLVQVHEGVASCDNCIGLLAGLALPDLLGQTKLRIEFDLRVEQIDPTAGRRIVLFQLVWGRWESGFTQHTLQLESRGGSFRAGLVEFATQGEYLANEEPAWPPFEHDFVPTGVLSQWMHVTYTLDADSVNSASNLAKLTVDDVILFDGIPRFLLGDPNTRMEIGVPWVDMSNFAAQDLSKRWQVRYDNVLVRSEPR